MIPGDNERECFICGSYDRIEEHHIFGGSDRQISDKYGLTVHLCNAHHHGTNGAHGRDGRRLQQYLHETGQQVIEKRWQEQGLSAEEARERFMREFRMSYL